MVEFPKFDKVLKEIRRDVKKFRAQIRTEEVGLVTESGDGIAHVTGLPHAMAGEMIKFSAPAAKLFLYTLYYLL